MTREVERRLPPRFPALSGTFVLPVLRGCGQMLFQPSARTGSVFLLLILSQSVPAFWMCLTGTLAATLCAYLLEHPEQAYFDGEGGFNGGLLGLALAVFYDFGIVSLLLALTGGVLAGLIRVGLLRLLPVPPFTAPFVLVAWLAFLGAELLALAPLEIPPVDPWQVYALTTNASQVLFMCHPWVGALLLLGVLIHSRIAALWVAAASLIAWVTALVFNLPAELTAAGLLGYNGMILAAALQHRATPAPLAVAGVVVSVWASYLFFLVGVTPLSAPFVLSAWLVIGAETVRFRRLTTPK